MRNKFLLFSIVLTILSVPTGAGQKLWYKQAADKWMQAIPIGNGRLSGMVYGGAGHDTVALNEISMWSGQPDSTSNDLCGREALAEMRDAFFKGDNALGNTLGEKYLTGRMTSFGTHVPVGDLVIDTDNTGEITAYTRQLELDKALTTVSYRHRGTAYTREYIADYPDDVIAFRYTADKKGSLTATIGFNLLREADIKASGNQLEFSGKVNFPMHGPGGVNFYGNLKADVEGGKVTASDGRLHISGADAFTLIFDLRTDYIHSDYKDLCRSTVEKASKKGFSSLRKAHIADYKRLYDRMSINFGKDTNSHIPTDMRMKAIAGGNTDTGFDALFFQYGRYMLISSSRPTDMPLCANLQGIWNDNGACNMPWTCDYHLDINTQQNYWSANRANLAECNEPLFKYLGLLARHGRDAASKIYGCRGWVAHTVCNAWGYSAPGWGVGWGMNVTGGAWLATHLWSHYLYTADNDYLRQTAYPILREAAMFFRDYMTEDKASGQLVTGPSISPENGYKDAEGRHFSLALMPTIDRVMVHDIYNACIRSAEILGIDDEFTARLRTDIKRLPPLAVGKDGLLKEWLQDVERADPSHRHSSHVHALFPLDQISYTKNPDLIEACRKSLTTQTSDPNWEDTEWSTANMLCFHARMKDGEAAHGWLQNLFNRFMRENLMTVSPAGVAMAEFDIFSFDATEGAVAGMCEMLMQCYDGFIEFLPALPSQWSSGEVKGLCAYDGLVVDMNWENGRMKHAALTASAKDCTVNVKDYADNLTIKKGNTIHLNFK